MKRLIAALLCALLLCASLPVLAESAGAVLPEGLPQALREYFSTPAFAGYVVDPGAFAECALTVSGSPHAYAFAVVRKNGYNVLIGFRDSGSGYRYFLRTDSALPQGTGRFALREAQGWYLSGASIPAHTLAVDYSAPGNEEFVNLSLFFACDSSGVWRLNRLTANDFGTDYYEAAPSSDGVRFYREGKSAVTVNGVMETGLRYFSWGAFPKTLSEAREKLTNPPDIPSGELRSQRVRFTGGQKFPVYSGPGTNYLRAANGKAAVSTNDWIQVFGTENGYLLIQYDLSSTQNRFGYIDQSALPAGASVSPLAFSASPAVMRSAAVLTDDPLNGKAPLFTLAQGESVTWLAAMGSWAYVEAKGNGQQARGFVPLSAVSRETPASAAYTGSDYTAQAALTLTVPSSATVTVTVTGPDAWNQEGADAVTGYRVYANNLPLDAVSSSLSTASAPWQRLFTLSCVLPAGTSVLALCPIHALTGQNAGEMLIFQLGGGAQ